MGCLNRCGQNEIVELLESIAAEPKAGVPEPENALLKGGEKGAAEGVGGGEKGGTRSEEEEEEVRRGAALVKAYQSSTDQEEVDLALICQILRHVCCVDGEPHYVAAAPLGRSCPT